MPSAAFCRIGTVSTPPSSIEEAYQDPAPEPPSPTMVDLGCFPKRRRSCRSSSSSLSSSLLRRGTSFVGGVLRRVLPDQLAPRRGTTAKKSGVVSSVKAAEGTLESLWKNETEKEREIEKEGASARTGGGKDETEKARKKNEKREATARRTVGVVEYDGCERRHCRRSYRDDRRRAVSRRTVDPPRGVDPPSEDFPPPSSLEPSSPHYCTYLYAQNFEEEEREKEKEKNRRRREPPVEISFISTNRSYHDSPRPPPTQLKKMPIANLHPPPLPFKEIASARLGSYLNKSSSAEPLPRQMKIAIKLDLYLDSYPGPPLKKSSDATASTTSISIDNSARISADNSARSGVGIGGFGGGGDDDVELRRTAGSNYHGDEGNGNVEASHLHDARSIRRRENSPSSRRSSTLTPSLSPPSDEIFEKYWNEEPKDNLTVLEKCWEEEPEDAPASWRRERRFCYEKGGDHQNHNNREVDDDRHRPRLRQGRCRDRNDRSLPKSRPPPPQQTPSSDAREDPSFKPLDNGFRRDLELAANDDYGFYVPEWNDCRQ